MPGRSLESGLEVLSTPEVKTRREVITVGHYRPNHLIVIRADDLYLNLFKNYPNCYSIGIIIESFPGALIVSVASSETTFLSEIGSIAFKNGARVDYQIKC
jgi:hypothetical protein